MHCLRKSAASRQTKGPINPSRWLVMLSTGVVHRCSAVFRNPRPQGDAVDIHHYVGSLLLIAWIVTTSATAESLLVGFCN